VRPLLALLLPALLAAAPPTRLVDHEVAEVRRWGRRLEGTQEVVAGVTRVLEAHDARRQELLRATLIPALAMDRAWGMIWNDQATLDASLPLLEERLRVLVTHERGRLVAAAATLADDEFVVAATELERRARGEPRLPRKHADQRALAAALEAAWATYQMAEPDLAAALEAGVRQGWQELQPLRRRWREVTDRVRAGLEKSSEWERHRWRQELEELAVEGEAVVGRARDTVLARLDDVGRQGLAVSVIRNLRRIGAVVQEHHTVRELELLAR
jgi:hypothetical protein